VPADFVALKSFPLTPNHKIDRKALPKPRPGTSSSGTPADLPQGENEEIISRIWSAVLGIENLDTNADFFELGGHSLLAVKVMASIEKETGKRLPLAVLFDNPNIKKLAKKLVSDEQSKWEVLVPIKTSGTKDPVFLIHGGGLNVILFKSISKYLDAEQPVYGLQALGLNHPTQLLYTLEEIAALYISEIMSVHPDGPYCLAGYSLGGFIAFEISRQLLEMGKTVKFLGILDTYAGNKDISDNISAKLSKKVKRQFNKIPFFTKSFLRSPREAVAYQVNVLKYKFDHLFSKEMESYTEHFSPYEKEIYRSYDIAHLCYTLKPADIRISLFNVRKRLYYLDDLVYLGWDTLAKKGVDIYGVPGDHKTFLYPPNDQEFARILQEALDKI
jgi:thioesterase domain-containing protein/acyl carrier protein